MKKELRIIGVSGGRDEEHGSLPRTVINAAMSDVRRITGFGFTHVLVGTYTGHLQNTDSIVARWTLQQECNLIVEPAQWRRLNSNSAGYLRNQRMLDTWCTNLVGWLFFPGASGTLDMLSRVKKAGIPYLEFDRERGWFRPL